MDRLPGFRDFYPEPLPDAGLWSADARQHIFTKWRDTARLYAFREYDGPPLEPLELFTLKSGDEIVGQLYNFTDKGGRPLALRPEMTPTLARMVAAHERSYKKPVKWFAIPQLFRYERQQKGRLREHFQFNADIIGESDSSADAELIALLVDTLLNLGLTAEDFVIRLSSRNAWHEFFLRHNGALDAEYEFFQAIDKIERQSEEENEAKLARLGFSLSQVQGFITGGVPTSELAAILKNLQARGLDRFVRVDYQVVRGLAYYTGPVFEAFDRKGEFRAIAGGGRYDNLIRLISGGKVNLPALGFGMGDVVLLELLKTRGALKGFSGAIDTFVLVEAEDLRGPSLGLVQDLRRNGLAVDYSLTPAKPEKQFKRALEFNATYAVRLVRSGSDQTLLQLKNLRTRTETTVTTAQAIEQMKQGA